MVMRKNTEQSLLVGYVVYVLAPYNNGERHLETRFFGSDDTGPLEEPLKLEEFPLIRSHVDVFVNESLRRMK